MPITQFFPVGRNTGVYYMYYTDNLNRPIANKVIELAIENLPTNKSTGEFYRTFKKRINKFLWKSSKN